MRTHLPALLLALGPRSDKLVIGNICSELEDFQKRFPVSPKMLICDRKMIFYLFIFEFIILLLCWQKPANASCSSNNARLPRWDIVISGKMSTWKWCLPLLSHLAKKQAPHFPTVFYSIKLTIKLRTSDRLNGKKKTTGDVLVLYRHVIANLVKVLSLIFV